MSEVTDTARRIAEGDRTKLMDWFKRNSRDLPWRDESREPYDIWVSEVMLQQTRVETVIPYYNKFMDKYPTLEHLAEADEEDVLNVWEGLGFYARARNLHSAAKQLLEDYDGDFPSRSDELQTLPGIGPSTAAAIVSFSYQKSEPYLDGNVFRVISRYMGYTENTETAEGRQFIESVLRASLPEERPGTFNEALIELGALVCTPSQPDCGACPIHEHCVAFRKNLQDELPYRGETRNIPTRSRTAVHVQCGDRILLTRRPSEGLLGGMWELPALWNRDEETFEETARRTLSWSLGREVQPLPMRETVNHTYSHFHLKMPLYRTRVDQEQTGEDLWTADWFREDEMEEIPVHGAARKALEIVL